MNINQLKEIVKNKLKKNIVCDKIEVEDKVFSEIFVFGNGMSGEYYKYKSLFLGFGKTLDEKWEIDIELRNPKTVSLSKFKYYADEPKKISDNSFLCR